MAHHAVQLAERSAHLDAFTDFDEEVHGDIREAIRNADADGPETQEDVAHIPGDDSSVGLDGQASGLHVTGTTFGWVSETVGEGIVFRVVSKDLVGEHFAVADTEEGVGSHNWGVVSSDLSSNGSWRQVEGHLDSVGGITSISEGADTAAALHEGQPPASTVEVAWVSVGYQEATHDPILLQIGSADEEMAVRDLSWSERPSLVGENISRQFGTIGVARFSEILDWIRSSIGKFKIESNSQRVVRISGESGDSRAKVGRICKYNKVQGNGEKYNEEIGRAHV